MDYEAIGNSYVKLGGLWVGTGAVLFSLGWFLISNLASTGERLQSSAWLKSAGKSFQRWRWFRFANEWLESQPWFETGKETKFVIFLCAIIVIVVGSVLVGKGGTVTTKGWNMISFGQQRKNLIRAVVVEALFNYGRFLVPPLKGETHTLHKDREYVFCRFPTLRSNAANAMLSSGFWGYDNAKDSRLLRVVSNHQMRISTANWKFSQYNDAVLRIADPNRRIAKAESVRELARGQEWFKDLRGTGKTLWELMWSEYRWAIPREQREYEFRVRGMQEAADSRVEEEQATGNK
jgi:hypothetical protein